MFSAGGGLAHIAPPPCPHYGEGMTMEGDAQRELYIAHRAALVDYCARILGSREAAEDIVQEAYLRYAAPARPVQTRDALAYLYRIVRNLSFDALKRLRIEAREQAGDPPHWIRPTAPETPEDAAILTDTVRIVSEVLAGLPLDVRIATEMYRFGGHTLEETAAHLGLSVATVHRHVRLALVRIALALEDTKS